MHKLLLSIITSDRELSAQCVFRTFKHFAHLGEFPLRTLSPTIEQTHSLIDTLYIVRIHWTVCCEPFSFFLLEPYQRALENLLVMYNFWLRKKHPTGCHTALVSEALKQYRVRPPPLWTFFLSELYLPRRCFLLSFIPCDFRWSNPDKRMLLRMQSTVRCIVWMQCAMAKYHTHCLLIGGRE